jgi:hypothetical protein
MTCFRISQLSLLLQNNKKILKWKTIQKLARCQKRIKTDQE